MTTQARAELLSDLGIEIPSIALEVDPTLAHDRFRIDLEGTPVIEGTVPPQGLLVDDEPAHLELLEIPYRQETPLINYRPALWVERVTGPLPTGRHSSSNRAPPQMQS